MDKYLCINVQIFTDLYCSCCMSLVGRFDSILYVCTSLYLHDFAQMFPYIFDFILFVQKCTDKYSKICIFDRFATISNHSYNTNCFNYCAKCLLRRFGMVSFRWVASPLKSALEWKLWLIGIRALRARNSLDTCGALGQCD